MRAALLGLAALLLHAASTHAFLAPALWLPGSRTGRTSNVCTRLSMQMVPPPPPPRKGTGPPPPPPKEDKEERPMREAGEWRDSILGDRKPRHNPLGTAEAARAYRPRQSPDQLREERARREKKEAAKNAPPPPPMLTLLEWQKALTISGARDFHQLYVQLEYAKAGDIASLERKWFADGASRAEVKKRVGQAMTIRTEAKRFPLRERPWGEGRKSHRPPKGEFFRYMHKQQKFDGKVLPMSAPTRQGIDEATFTPLKTFTQPAIESARGSDPQRQLPSFSQRKGGRGGRGGKRP